MALACVAAFVIALGNLGGRLQFGGHGGPVLSSYTVLWAAPVALALVPAAGLPDSSPVEEKLNPIGQGPDSEKVGAGYLVAFTWKLSAGPPTVTVVVPALVMAVEPVPWDLARLQQNSDRHRGQEQVSRCGYGP